MLYLDYERYKERFKRAQAAFDKILLEKERLLTKTLPNAITYDRDLVETSPNGDILDNYVIALEEGKIDAKIGHFREIMIDRERLMILKERELRKSMDRIDRVYVCKYLECMSMNKMTQHLPYSKTQIWRLLKEIKGALRKEGTI